MAFWDKLRKDIKKGFDEGLHAFKEGTTVIRKRAGTLSDDVKNKVKVFELKQKIQVLLTDLGGRVYEVASDKRRNPMTNEKITAIVEKIRKIEGQIEKLEAGIPKKVTRRAKPGKKTAKKAAKKITSKKPAGRAVSGKRSKKA